MGYTGSVIHYDFDATTVLNDLTSRKTSAEFTLRRLGGCGPAEIKLKDMWNLRNVVRPGHWIALDYEAGNRWYFGRVENVSSDLPAGQTVNCEGMSIQLGEINPGGMGYDSEDLPIRYAKSDYFPYDRDWSYQSWVNVSQPEDVVRNVFSQYINTRTDVTSSYVDNADPRVGLNTITFRGEETVLSMIRALGVACRDASWGIDENKRFFFMQKRADILATFKAGYNVQQLNRKRDRSLLYNRLLITGDYIYLNPNSFGTEFYRYRSYFHVPDSISVYGERRTRVYLPWIRRNEDAIAFAKEFFRKYATLTDRYFIRTNGTSILPRPWDGQIELQDTDGTVLMVSHFDSIRVDFNHSPYFEFDLGPEDLVYNDDPRDDRWEMPRHRQEGLPPPSLSLPPTWTGTMSNTTSTSSTSTSTTGPICVGCDWTCDPGETTFTLNDNGNGCTYPCDPCSEPEPLSTPCLNPLGCTAHTPCGAPTTTTTSTSTSGTTTPCVQCNTITAYGYWSPVALAWCASCHDDCNINYTNPECSPHCHPPSEGSPFTGTGSPCEVRSWTFNCIPDDGYTQCTSSTSTTTTIGSCLGCTFAYGIGGHAGWTEVINNCAEANGCQPCVAPTSHPGPCDVISGCTETVPCGSTSTTTTAGPTSTTTTLGTTSTTTTAGTTSTTTTAGTTSTTTTAGTTSTTTTSGTTSTTTTASGGCSGDAIWDCQCLGGVPQWVLAVSCGVGCTSDNPNSTNPAGCTLGNCNSGNQTNMPCYSM